MGESYSPRRLPPKTASRFLPTLPPSPVLMFYRSGPPQAPASPPHPEYYLPLAEDKFSTGCLREDLDRPSLSQRAKKKSSTTIFYSSARRKMWLRNVRMRRASASQSSETINTRMALAGRDRERKEEGAGTCGEFGGVARREPKSPKSWPLWSDGEK